MCVFTFCFGLCPWPWEPWEKVVKKLTCGTLFFALVPQHKLWIHFIFKRGLKIHFWGLRKTSAGFSLELMWRHCSTFDSPWMMETLFATYVLNLFVFLALYWRTVMLSHQKTDSSSFMSSSVFSILFMRTDNTAAASSSLGTVVCFSGATLSHYKSNIHISVGV